MEIQLSESGSKGSAYIESDGKKVAEMIYSKAGESKIIIDHTEVDPSLKGQGVGRQLLDKVVSMARKRHQNIAAMSVCPCDVP